MNESGDFNRKKINEDTYEESTMDETLVKMADM